MFTYLKKIKQLWNESFEQVTIKYYNCIDNIVEYNFPKKGFIEWNTQTTMYNLHIDILESLDETYLENISINHMVNTYREALINTLNQRSISYKLDDTSEVNNELSRFGNLELRQFDYYEYESNTLTTEELINNINNIYKIFYKDWEKTSVGINWKDYETLMGLIMGSSRFRSQIDHKEKLIEHVTEIIRRLLIGVS